MAMFIRRGKMAAPQTLDRTPTQYTGPVGHGQRRAWLNAQAQTRPGQQGGVGQERILPPQAKQAKRPPAPVLPAAPVVARPRPRQAQAQTEVPVAGMNPLAEAKIREEGQKRAIMRTRTR